MTTNKNSSFELHLAEEDDMLDLHQEFNLPALQVDYSQSQVDSLSPINVVLPELKLLQCDVPQEAYWTRPQQTGPPGQLVASSRTKKPKPITKNVGRPRKRQHRVPHLKKDSKVSLETKLRNFEAYMGQLRRQGRTQVLMRTHVVRELGYSLALLRDPQLIMPGWHGLVEGLERESWHADPVLTPKVEHTVSCRRTNKGTQIYLHFSHIGNTPSEHQLTVHSMAVPQPQGGFQWFHYVRGGAYVTLALFVLGSDFDYPINDNQAEPTIGNDLKVISAKKRCTSRLRSHAKSAMVPNPWPPGTGSVLDVRQVESSLQKQLNHHTFFQLNINNK